MAHDLVYALAKLGILVRQKLSANSCIARPPRAAAIVRPIDATSGHRDEHLFRLTERRNDGVQTQPTAAGLPARSVFVLEQSFDRSPGLTRVARDEER